MSWCYKLDFGYRESRLGGEWAAEGRILGQNIHACVGMSGKSVTRWPTGRGALPAHYRDNGEVGVPVSDLWLPARPGWALCRLRRRRCRSD